MSWLQEFKRLGIPFDADEAYVTTPMFGLFVSTWVKNLVADHELGIETFYGRERLTFAQLERDLAAGARYHARKTDERKARARPRRRVHGS